MSDQHFQTIATAGANVGSCRPARECRRNDASNWQGEWLDASCLYVASIFCSDMTNDSIEEVLRLPAPFFSMKIHFCHYQAVWCVRSRWRGYLLEGMSM